MFQGPKQNLYWVFAIGCVARRLRSFGRQRKAKTSGAARSVIMVRPYYILAPKREPDGTCLKVRAPLFAFAVLAIYFALLDNTKCVGCQSMRQKFHPLLGCGRASSELSAQGTEGFGAFASGVHSRTCLSASRRDRSFL